MLFQYFKVPERHTQRVLTWGIFSALVLRGIMIAVGVAAVQRFRWVLLIFALVLVFSAYKVRRDTVLLHTVTYRYIPYKVKGAARVHTRGAARACRPVKVWWFHARLPPRHGGLLLAVTHAVHAVTDAG